MARADQAADSLPAEPETRGGRPVPEIVALRVNPHPPRIDGELDDAIWQGPRIQRVCDFTQREPNEGEAPTESTTVAVAYDEDALYVAFWCYDSQPDGIARQLVRRDRGAESDLVVVRLDPYHDHQTGYEFYVSAAGVQVDQRVYNDDWTDSSWDAVWESEVDIHPWGWAAEYRIPFDCLRFPVREEHVWGIDFARLINRKSENMRWAFVPRSAGGFVSNFGHLRGLSGISSGRHLELLPYVVSSVETEPVNVGNPDGRYYMRNMGLDLKYGLASNLVLDAAINPDFGQVELDQPVLNLSTFETWFPERRPFFLEGADLFDADFDLFYSRRIGRAPQGHVDDGGFEYYADYPRATTILGAAKLTGKIGGRTNVAALTAVTEEETAEYIAAGGERREGIVAPAASYSVLRVKRDVLGNSNAGAMLTSANWRGRHPAVTGGIDWRLRTAGNRWGTEGMAIFSRVNGEVTGYGYDCTFRKAAGEHVQGAIGGTIKDPNLDINDLGYTNRNNYRGGWTWWQYRTSDDIWIVRNSWNNVNLSGGWNYAGHDISGNWNFNNSVEFTNGWWGGCGYSESFARYDDRETRGRGVWERPPAWNAWVWVDTDERKPFSVEIDYSFGNSRTSPWWGAELLLRHRPAANLEFSVHGEFTHDFGQLMWVTNPDDSTSVFADKDQDIFELDATAGWVIRRNLSCQLSASGLLSGLDYHGYRPYLGDGRYGGDLDGFDSDYHYAALNSTLLLRWEYRPGSALYLVWTRAQSEVDPTTNDLDLGRDLDRWLSGDAENVFLIKASYRMSL